MSDKSGAAFDRDQRLEELRQAHRAALTAGDFQALDEIQIELDGLMTAHAGMGASPAERASRYRQRAVFARQQAETETDPTLRERFLGEAAEYEDLAKTVT